MDVFLLLLALMLLAGLVWHAMLVAPNDLQLTVHHVEVPGLPLSFDGYRIAVLADFHHGPQQPISRARRAVAYANSQAPHLVALLGDYGTSEPFVPGLSRLWYQRMFQQLGPVLQELRARDGVLAVIGNHDYYAGGDETARWLEGLGFRVLRSSALDLPSPEGTLRIVGLDDLEEGDVDAGTIATLVAGDAPVVVLSHHPDAIRHCEHPNIRLVLSGHTHGGQVVLPWIGAPLTRSELCPPTHPSGWIPNPHNRLYVSRGIGIQVPVRLGALPEVVVITLRVPARVQP